MFSPDGQLVCSGRSITHQGINVRDKIW